LLVVAGKDAIGLWDAAAGTELMRLARKEEREYVSAAVAADGGRLLFQKSDPQGAGLIQMWDVPRGKELWKIADKNYPLFHVPSFTPDGKVVAATNVFALEITRWDAATGGPLEPLRAPRLEVEAVGQGLVGLAFSHDGGMAASYAPLESTIRLWGTVPGREVSHVSTGQHEVSAFCFSPDGRVLAVGEGRAVRLVELATGTERHRFTGHERRIESLAFAPDGKTLASGSEDTTVLLWDLSGRTEAPRAAPKAKELDALWEDLAGAAPRAYRAMRRLLAAPPAETAALLKEHLLEAAAADRRIARWIADLDHDTFEVREKASAELARRGKDAEPRLRAVLRGEPSPEVRLRVEGLLLQLSRMNTLAPEELATIRALEVLETMGTPESRRVLEALARAGEGGLAREARASLDRLDKRPRRGP
jgi:hypothetical protein